MPKSSKTPAKPSAAQRRKTAAPKGAAGKDGSSKAPSKPRGGAAVKAPADGKTATVAVDFNHKPVGIAGTHEPAISSADLTEFERGLLGDLLAVIEEHASDAALEIDRQAVEQAFVFACEHHADQRRRSGEDFIIHPVGVAKICAGMRLDTETLCAALLHDTVEDTSASLAEVREAFGEEVATLVDGVTKLTGITFQSRDERQAENYRKMIVAMAADVRVILIKLADRLHNMRTLGPMPKQKQQE
jgi:guanosine-3',5'-bis(diphosphate) 3'-pyrophosphohydrolase